MTTKPLGLFDSGIGGLSMLKELTNMLPYEDMIYLGDNARMPYGDKPKATLTCYALEGAEFLVRQGIKGLILACHTLSTQVLPLLQKELEIPVFGMLLPKKNDIGVLATEATIESGVYQWAARLVPVTPLVDKVENGGQTSLAALLDSYPEKTWALGCTHLAFLKRDFAQLGITLIDPTHYTAQHIRQELIRRNLLNDSGGKLTCYFTGAQTKAQETLESLNLVAEVKPCAW